MLDDKWFLEVARRKVRWLNDTAYQHYQLSEVLQAAEVYGKALEVAEVANAKELVVHCRRWCGATLYRAEDFDRLLQFYHRCSAKQ